MIDFTTIHDGIKTSIEDDGFDYKERHFWPNVETGIIPTEWIGKGFAITRLNLVPVTDDEQSHLHYYLNIQVEFAHDTLQDNYLSRYPYMITAIKNLFTAITGNNNPSALPDEWFAFYEVNVPQKQAVICVFDNLMYLQTIS